MSSKLMRSELKSIVKECLVEILSEGLLYQEAQLTESKQHTPKRTKQKRKKLGYLDKINFNKKNKKINTALTKDPILNEVLSDTANTTLVDQINADKNNHMSAVAVQGDTAAKIVNNSNPEDIFGGAADKWASLAFS